MDIHLFCTKKRYIQFLVIFPINPQLQHLSQSLSWDLLLRTKEKWCLKKNRVSMPQRGFSMYLANHQNLLTWKIHVHMLTKLYNVISTEHFSIWTVSHIHCLVYHPHGLFWSPHAPLSCSSWLTKTMSKYEVYVFYSVSNNLVKCL